MNENQARREKRKENGDFDQWWTIVIEWFVHCWLIIDSRVEWNEWIVKFEWFEGFLVKMKENQDLEPKMRDYQISFIHLYEHSIARWERSKKRKKKEKSKEKWWKVIDRERSNNR